MLLTKTMTMKWSNRIKKYYESLGYIFTFENDEFVIDIKDLSIGSGKHVDIKCDSCGKVMSRPYWQYIKLHDEEFGDTCKKCGMTKFARDFNIKYGVSNPSQLDSVKDKKVETCRNNFGVDYPMQSKEVYNKSIDTRVELYGVEHSMQIPRAKEQSKLTSIENWGVDNPSKSPEVVEKIWDTKIKNGTNRSSISERNTVEMLKTIYGEKIATHKRA